MSLNLTLLIKRLLIIFLILAGLILAKVFLIPIAIGCVLATLFLPFNKWIEEYGISRLLAAFISVLILCLGTLALAALLSWKINDLIIDIVLIKEKIFLSGAKIQVYLFEHFGISETKQWAILNSEQPSITSSIQLIFSSLSSILTTYFLILMYAFCLLYYRHHLKQFLLKLFPISQQVDADKIIHNAALVSQQYLVGLSKMIVCLWLMYGVGFSLIGIQNAIFFAILCGFLEIIPYIGNITGTILTLLVATVNGASYQMLIGIFIIYISIQLIQGWLLEPLIVGRQVKLNAFATIVALIVGELIWGIGGIFLAIPITAILKTTFDQIEPLKVYGFLIGEVKSK